MEDAGTWALVVLTAVLAVATFHYARTVAGQRADVWLPLLHWQEPNAAVAADFRRNIARLQFHIVLWNVGPGAARIRKRVATTGNLVWTFSHFEEPSIVPNGEQLIVQLYVDVPILTNVTAGTFTARVPEGVELCIQFEDVVERNNYTSKPTIEFVPPAALPPHSDIPVEPAPPTPGHPSLIPGVALKSMRFNPDSRSPSARKVPRERESC